MFNKLHGHFCVLFKQQQQQPQQQQSQQQQQQQKSQSGADARAAWRERVVKPSDPRGS